MNRQLYGGISFKYVDYALLKDSPPLNVTIPNGNATVIGGGPTLVFDSRDHLLTPSKGSYFWFKRTILFASEINYLKLIVDFRKYFSGSKGNTLSMRLLQEFCTTESPYFDLPRIGGDDITRGIYSGRFFDNNSSVLQLEYKYTVYRRWGIAVFGGGSTCTDGIWK